MRTSYLRDPQRNRKNGERREEMANNFAAEPPQPLFSLVPLAAKGEMGDERGLL